MSLGNEDMSINISWDFFLTVELVVAYKVTKVYLDLEVVVKAMRL